MHVAQFVHRYPPALGGAEAWAERLSQFLVASGNEVSVWTTTAIELAAFTGRGHLELPAGSSVAHGVQIRRFAPSFRWRQRRVLMKVASLLPIPQWQSMTQPWAPVSLDMWREAGRSQKPVDVVHAIAFPYAAIIESAYRLADRHRARFVITPFLHLGDPADREDPIRRAYMAPHLQRLLHLADRVIVQTPTEALAAEAMGVAGERLVLQGLGVDGGELAGGDRFGTRNKWGLSATDVVVGHLANQSQEKGTIDLVRAAMEARQSNENIRVVLAGPRMKSFDDYAKRLGPQPWLKQLGPISDADKGDFFAAIDLFALPSRSDSFGLVFLEAWANGKPVIGYAAGGVVDVIRHEEDGLLVPCGFIPGLANAIIRLGNSEQLRVLWGEAGRRRIPHEFQWTDKLKIARRVLTGT